MGRIEVEKFLKQKNIDMKIIELKDSSTVEKAAFELNVNTNHIGKTLGFYVSNKPIVILMSGDAKVDNQKFKEYFKEKAKMIPLEEVEDVLGHPVGGVCPFGLKEDVIIFLDKSLEVLKNVYPAAGEFNLALKIKTDELQNLLNAKYIDVCKMR